MRRTDASLILLLVIALPSCGTSTPTSSNPAPAQPPTGSFTVSPAGGPALVGATTLTFFATASDPAGLALTYTWDFGDGQKGFTGQTVTHVYNTPGTFNVVVTIRNAAGATATANATVTARDITGHWVDADPGFQLDFVQSGNSFTGTVTVSGFGMASKISQGLVSDPRNVAFYRQSFVARFATAHYRGSLDATLDHMNVVAVEASRLSFTLTRQ